MAAVASYDLENLFSRPKAFNTGNWTEGEKILASCRMFNTPIAAETYSDVDEVRMREQLLTLRVYYRNTHGAIGRLLTKRTLRGRRCRRTGAASTPNPRRF